MEKEYLAVLEREKGDLDPEVFTHAYRLLTKEYDIVERGNKYLELHSNKKCRITAKVLIPVNDFPEVNLVGKLLGPGGGTLKEISQATGCKLSILGKGSMRDKEKEEESRKSNDPKFHHLYDELHIQVEVLAPPLDGYMRLGAALSEIKPLLQPDPSDYGGRDSFRGRGGRGAPHMMPPRGGPRGGATNGRGGRMPPGGYDPYEPQGYFPPYDSGYGGREESSHFDYSQDGYDNHGGAGGGYGSYEGSYGNDYDSQQSSFGKAPRGRGDSRGRPYQSRGGPRGGRGSDRGGGGRGRGGRGN